MVSLTDQGPATCHAGTLAGLHVDSLQHFQSTFDISKCAVQGPDAGSHVDSLQHFTATLTLLSVLCRAPMLASACTACRASLRLAVLASLRPQAARLWPSRPLGSCWRWRRARHPADLRCGIGSRWVLLHSPFSAGARFVPVDQVNRLVDSRWVTVHSASQRCIAALNPVCGTCSGWLTPDKAMHMLVTLSGTFQPQQNISSCCAD